MGKVAFQSHEAGVLLNSGKRFRPAKMRGWKSYSRREDARIYYIVMQNQYTHPLPDDPNPLSGLSSFTQPRVSQLTGFRLAEAVSKLI